MRRDGGTKGFTEAVCCVLAGGLLIVSLFGEIRLETVRDEIHALEREEKTLEERRSVLSVRLAKEMDLGKIERYATEVLGMQRCRPEQLVELELSP